jgi:hypothetical protein
MAPGAGFAADKGSDGPVARIPDRFANGEKVGSETHGNDGRRGDRYRDPDRPP